MKLFSRRTSARSGAGTRGAGATGGTRAGDGSGRRVTLIARPGCHLCDIARGVVERVAAECGADWIELDVTADAALAEKYAEQIPVVLVDGEQHDFWRIDEARLRAALL